VNEPHFISRAVVEMIHRRSLEQHGGQDGIRDENAFESALAQPMNTFFYGQGDLFDIAAAYAFHLAENQPFIDGNKRTAISTALMFLDGNGVPTDRLTDAQLYEAMIALAEKRLDKPGLAAVFRRHLSA
jgi:death on curing protein